jgi:hypothetical protein
MRSKIKGSGNGTGSTEIAEAPLKGGRRELAEALKDAEQAAVPGGKKFGRKIPGKSMQTIDASKLMVTPAVMTVTVVGQTPLLVHNFGAKAIQMILDKQTGKAKAGPRALKDPFEDFRQSLYIIDKKRVPKKRLEPGQHWPFVKDTFGFPASGFKKAMVSACSFVEGIPKTWVRGLVHIHGDLLPIKYDKLIMRQDTVRVGPFGKKSADIRFRGEFHDWSVQLRISYNRAAVSPEQIGMLINNAGFSVGVGEWRPEKDGSSGTFAIE